MQKTCFTFLLHSVFYSDIFSIIMEHEVDTTERENDACITSERGESKQICFTSFTSLNESIL